MYENTWIINPYMMQVFEVWRNRYYKELYTPLGWMECTYWFALETSRELSTMIDVSEGDVRRWLRENLSTMNTIHPKYLGTSPFKGRSVDYEFIWFFMLLFTNVSQVVQAVEDEGTVIFRDMQIRLARIMYEDFSELNTLDWSPQFINAWLISEDEYGGIYNYAYFIQGDENTRIDEIRWGNMGWNYNMLERMLDGIRCASKPDGSCQTPLDFTYSIFCIYNAKKLINNAQRLNRNTLSLEDFQRSSYVWAPLIGYNISWQDLVNDFKITCRRLNRRRRALNYPGGIK